MICITTECNFSFVNRGDDLGCGTFVGNSCGGGGSFLETAAEVFHDGDGMGNGYQTQTGIVGDGSGRGEGDYGGDGWAPFYLSSKK